MWAQESCFAAQGVPVLGLCQALLEGLDLKNHQTVEEKKRLKSAPMTATSHWLDRRLQTQHTSPLFVIAHFGDHDYNS